MHPYVTDSNERRDVALILAGLSIALSLLVSKFLKFCELEIPSWIDVTSVAGFYALIYTFFDKYWWKWSISRFVGIVKVPLISGVWRGYILSSHDDFALQHPVDMHIEQNWTRIRISLQGELSRSHSFLAAIFIDAHDGTVLDYEYQNDPIAGAGDAMQIHYGTARLRLLEGGVLDGHYYTGRGRSNFGRVYLHRDR